tara:strand:+ start:871 stop:1146 length:276 start_codon:yes stop_codon:yes gene_type:complete
MEVKIRGYKYEEKEAATLKRGLLVTEKELPRKEKDVTLYWQNYEEASLNKPVFWYIEFDPSFPKSFGKPETFNVTFPDAPKDEGEEVPKKK